MTEIDGHLPGPQQSEIQRLLGQCLLRLQAYERLMKAIVAEHRLFGETDELEAIRGNQAAETGRKTLGILAGEMTSSFLLPEGSEPDSSWPENLPSFGVHMRLILPREAFEQAEMELRELVALRNRLVHHFLEDHELVTPDGRHKAQESLLRAQDRVGRAFEQLRSWAAALNDSKTALGELLSSPDIAKLLAGERIPWAMSEVVKALSQAAAELSVDGWTEVNAAIDWIGTHFSNASPGAYGCRTWRQVIHESGLFELKSRNVQAGRRQFYRPRTRLVPVP